MTVLLEVDDLHLHYATTDGTVRAVDGMSLTVDGDGEVVGVIGESGSGKTSLALGLLRLLPRNVERYDGALRLAGQNLMDLSDAEMRRRIRWRQIAMVFQGAMNVLNPVVRVGRQIAEPMVTNGAGTPRESAREVARLLELTGLPAGTAQRYPHELSGGMKQRVVIAMALLLEPDLLIADEPTTALDVLVQSQIIGLLKKLRREKGVTIILITHDLALVSQIADKIAIMYAGQLVEIASTKDIYKNPRHPYTQALIAAVPKLRSNEKKIHFVKGSPPSLLNPPSGCRFYARCPHAMDVCEKDPPEFQTDTGYVRCWLYDGEHET